VRGPSQKFRLDWHRYQCARRERIPKAQKNHAGGFIGGEIGARWDRFDQNLFLTRPDFEWCQQFEWRAEGSAFPLRDIEAWLRRSRA
jgi:hypothetical protein